MKSVMCVPLAILSSLLIATGSVAQTEAVTFSVDGVAVAELESYWSTQGIGAGPLMLAGRSGPDGADERSGLHDNLEYCAWFYGPHAVGDIDPFDSLDTWKWGLYGGPSPHLLEDFGNPPPCLMTSGDSSYASGLYSLQATYFVGPGTEWWYMHTDVHVGSAEQFHSVEFGLGDDLAPSGPPGEQTLGHVIGVILATNAQGETVLQCSTDIDYEEVPAGMWIGGWHTIRIASYNTVCPVEVSSWGRVKALFR